MIKSLIKPFFIVEKSGNDSDFEIDDKQVVDDSDFEIEECEINIEIKISQIKEKNDVNVVGRICHFYPKRLIGTNEVQSLVMNEGCKKVQVNFWNDGIKKLEATNSKVFDEVTLISKMTPLIVNDFLAIAYI